MLQQRATAKVIVLIACVLGVLCIALSLVYTLYSREDVMISYRNILAQNADVVAEFTSILFGDVDRIALMLASDLGDANLSAIDARLLHREMELMSAGTPGVAGMFVLDKHGDAIATLSPAIAPGQTFSDKPYFYEQMSSAGNKPFLQQTTYSDVSNQWRMYFSRPIMRAPADKVGVVGIALNPDTLVSVYSRVRPAQGTVVVLVDQNYRIAARYPEDESLYGMSLERSVIFQRLANTVEDAVSTVAVSLVDGRERLMVARRLADQPMTIAISVPIDEILGPWRTKSAAVVATGAALALVLLSGGWIMARRQGEQETSAAQIESLLAIAPAGIAVLGPLGQFIRQNDRWRLVADALSVEREARNDLPSFLANLRSRGLLQASPEEIRWPRPEGAAFDIKDTGGERTASFRIIVQAARASGDGGGPQSIALAIDNTEHEQLEALLRGQLTTDSVTGLRNRRGLIERAQHTLASADVIGVLLVCEVLGVEELIASRGFDDGEQVIEAIAGRLRRLEATGAVVARLHGYVFGVFQAVTDGGKAIEAASLRRLLEGEYRLSGRTTFVRLAIGGAEQRGEPAHRLVHCAEIALGRARRAGTAKTIFFNPELEVASRERVELSEALQRAVLDRQFVLYYQPKVSLESGEVVALEALIRWRHPIFGLQGPGLFMSLAEATGLIVDIGDWVIEEVCRQQAVWRTASRRLVPVAVNVSPIQFDHRNIVEQVSTQLVAHDLGSALVTVEVTETTISDNTDDMLAAIRDLRAAGICVALDDFGSGYSSLGAIAGMSIDEIKIDRSFVENIAFDPISQQIVQAIVAIGRTLNLSVTAEGVETEEQRKALIAAGCRLAQGYFFYRPMPARDVQALLPEAGSAA